MFLNPISKGFKTYVLGAYLFTHVLQKRHSGQGQLGNFRVHDQKI
jgi:hypothetical protein